MTSRLRLLLRAWRRRLSRSHWAAGLLGVRRPAVPAPASGLIMIQIDGLSRVQFEQALRRRRMPFLRGLVGRGGFSLGSFYSGLPSTTPAVQAEIFYGVTAAVPGFQFMRRDSAEVFRMYESRSVTVIERELAARGGPPLLAGGHSYANSYRGGAAASWYCPCDLEPGLMVRRMRPLHGLFLAAVYSVRIARVFGLAALELVLALTDLARGLYDRSNFVKELMFVPARIGICILVREMIRFRVLLDLECGIRVIHANFLGYDEQAHRRGPASAFAHWTLKGIDRAVRDICRASRRSVFRHYRVIIYSDHGQERVVPFASKTGRSIEAAVEAVVARGSLAGCEVFIPKIPEIVGSTITKWQKAVGMRPLDGVASAAGDLGRKIVVTALGPVGHVYLPRMPDPQELETRAAELVASGGVPLVVIRSVRAGEPLHAFNRRGRWCLPRDGREVIGGGHAFFGQVLEDFMRLCRHPDAGDLILCGWDPFGGSVSFPLENGAHAGPGYEETHGFVLLPPGVGSAAVPLRGSDLREIARGLLGDDDMAGGAARRLTPV